MAADIQNVIRELGFPNAPSVITQESFDDDPSHYHRICLRWANPDPMDLCSYADDLMYQDIQIDLFRYFLPICLSAWQKDLMASHKSEYLGFVEQFSGALAMHNGFKVILKPSEHEAVSDFMCHSILDKIDQERELSFSGMGASPYSWIDSIGSHGMAFTSIGALWNEWWGCGTMGRACGVLQYASVLMYSDDENPIFSPWTPEKGGGAPTLWETNSHIFDLAWLPENLDFLRTALTPAHVINSVSMAARLLHSSSLAQIMAADCEARAEFLGCRIEELIQYLSLPLGEVRDWVTK